MASPFIPLGVTSPWPTRAQAPGRSQACQGIPLATNAKARVHKPSTRFRPPACKFAWTLLLALGLVACSGTWEDDYPRRPIRSFDPVALGSPSILSLRARAELQDRWRLQRLESLLPTLMRREGIDLWVVASREYNEDPLFASLAPSSWHNARRRTLLIFHDARKSGPVDCLSLSRYELGPPFQNRHDPEGQDPTGMTSAVWSELSQLIQALDPATIAVNTSATFALADGISASDFDGMIGSLPPSLQDRIVSAEALAVGWLETRSQSELLAYPDLVRIAHQILAEGLSERVIRPGVTRTTDLVWWFRERLAELRLGAWFQPTVDLQRRPQKMARPVPAGRQAKHALAPVIERGDLVHVDMGLDYLGLKTDIQQLCYVLQPGERTAPSGLRRGLATANKLQDLLLAEFEVGRSGNEVLAASLSSARAAGIEATIYTHPLGLHGHGAGPTIGLWDQQGGVPGRGDARIHANTVYAIELCATVPVPEWDDLPVRFPLEEDAWFDGRKLHWLDGRQSQLHLVR